MSHVSKLIPFLFGLALLSPSQVLADDDRTLPGANCHELYYASTYADSSGRRWNTSSSAKYWICPIQRERTWDRVNYAYMYVYDQHYSSNISCTLYMRYETGSSYDYSSASTSGSDTATKTLTFGEVSSESYGYQYFYCSIPASYSGSYSGIVSYLTDEEDD